MHMLNGSMDPQALAFSAQAQNQPRLMYFISRNNGLLVPLIPADELPYNVKLQNVPRVLRFDQTVGMQHVGAMPFTGFTFKLENDNAMMHTTNRPTHNRSDSASSSKQFLPPDALARQAMANATGTGHDIPQHTLPQRPMSADELKSTNWRKNAAPMPPTSSDKTQAIIDAITGGTSGTGKTAPPPSGKQPDEDKKIWCTHWIRTGECDYTQQGCLFKHDMPDLKTLQDIGFRGIPRWWLEKNPKVKMGAGNTVKVGAGMPSWWPGQKKEVAKDTSSSDSSDGSASDAGSEGSDPPKAPVTSTKKPVSEPVPAITTSVSQKASAKMSPKELSETDDLIDFSMVMTPGTTPSTSPERVLKPTSANIRSQPAQAKNAEEDTKQPRTTKPNNSKVFVPAGESAEAHIADAQKRASRHQGASSCNIKPTDAAPLEKQIQTMQKSKNNGLMSSKHAVPMKEANASTGGWRAETRKRVPKKADSAISIRSPNKAD